MTNDIKENARELAEAFNELEAINQQQQYGILLEFVATVPEALHLFKKFVHSATDSLPENVIPFLRYK